MVCDQCWHLSGGASAVRAKLADNGEGEQLEPLLVFDPAVESVLAGADEYDLLHPIDRLLVESGVRWVVLRHIAVPARMDLVRWVLERTPPEGTRPADSPDVWMEAVEDRVRAQTGTEFRYAAKRRRWWRICNVLRHCADRSRRPLTWVTQEEIAAAVGCSTRTVRRCVAWLRREGLLFEVVPGCQLPQQTVPDGETVAERDQRHRAMGEAIAVEQAAMARARAELAAIRAGHHGAQAVEAAQRALVPEVRAAAAQTDSSAAERALVQLAPVYELRLPHSPAEQAEAEAIARAHTVLRGHGAELAWRFAAELVHPTNAHLHAELDAISHDGRLTRLTTPEAVKALTSGNAGGLLRVDQNGHPPKVYNQDPLKSRCVHAVDKRRAPRGSDKQRVPAVKNGSGLPAAVRAVTLQGAAPRARQSEAVRAAEWLLRSRLDPRVCDEVSVRWLAAQIRSSHLLDQHEWTWDDLADQLHGYPEYTHLPRYIRDCRSWIRARLRRACPALSPSKLRIVQHIERTSPKLQQRRQAEAEQARRAEIAQRRAAINACGLCDENGLLDLGNDTPLVRCNHDPNTAGW